MEACVTKGLVRSIGVSNFNSEQIIRLMEVCAIKPVTNQVRIMPNNATEHLRIYRFKEIAKLISK